MHCMHGHNLSILIFKNSFDTSNVQFEYMMLRGNIHFCTNADGKSIFKAEAIVETAVVKQKI